MLALAGGMLVEISLLKLIVAWALLLVVPGILLGFVPIATTMWFRAITDNVASPELGLWTAVLLLAAAAIGWFGLAASLPARRNELLVAQRPPRPANLCGLPRGAASFLGSPAVGDAQPMRAAASFAPGPPPSPACCSFPWDFSWSDGHGQRRISSPR